MHVHPETQTVAPVQPLPPHCAHGCAYWAEEVKTEKTEMTAAMMRTFMRFGFWIKQ